MRYFLPTWLCGLVLTTFPLVIQPGALTFGLMIGWLLLISLGTITQDFRVFAAAGVVGFGEYALLIFGISALTDFGALVIGLVLFVMLESSYLACLISGAEKRGYSGVTCKVAEQVKDWKRWYLSLAKRTAILAGLGTALILLLRLANLILIPAEWYFPLLLAAAVSLGVLLYRTVVRRL